jgi:hypothetical protein
VGGGTVVLLQLGGQHVDPIVEPGDLVLVDEVQPLDGLLDDRADAGLELRPSGLGLLDQAVDELAALIRARVSAALE